MNISVSEETLTGYRYRLLGVLVGHLLTRATKKEDSVHHVGILGPRTLLGLYNITVTTVHGRLHLESVRLTLNLFSDSLLVTMFSTV